jgi:probable selenium-dependent hydroxylase accessory protein YqeC
MPDVRQLFYEAFQLDSFKYLYVVGGGGKTSLIQMLSEAIRQRGHSVISTTTTKIRIPTADPDWEIRIGSSVPDHSLCDQSKPFAMVLGRSLDPQKKKILGGSWQELDALREQCPLVNFLVEADGSRGRSLKAYNPAEPVVSPHAQSLVVVLGIDVLGKPVDDRYVHRSEIAQQWLGVGISHHITEENVADLIYHPRGCLRDLGEDTQVFFFINKVSNSALKRQAARLKRVLKERWGEWLAGSNGTSNTAPIFLSGSLENGPWLIENDLDGE